MFWLLQGALAVSSATAGSATMLSSSNFMSSGRSGMVTTTVTLLLISAESMRPGRSAATAR